MCIYVYTYTRIHVSPYNPSMVREHGQQCGMPTVPGNPWRHLLQHPQLCLSSRPAHCCPCWSASQTEVCCAFLKPALVEQFLCFTCGRGMDANCCPLGKNLGNVELVEGKGRIKRREMFNWSPYLPVLANNSFNWIIGVFSGQYRIPLALGSYFGLTCQLTRK